MVATAGLRVAEVGRRGAARFTVASVARMYDGSCGPLGRATALAAGRGIPEPPRGIVPRGDSPLAKGTRTGSRDFPSPEVVEVVRCVSDEAMMRYDDWECGC